MNRFTRCENGVIADAAVYNRLQNQEASSILLLSDTHGAVDAVRWIFTAFCRECPVCLFAGDGAGDIITVVREAAADSFTIPQAIVMVQGNCDCQQYPPLFSDSGIPQVFCLPVRQQMILVRRHILLTHGHQSLVEFDGRRLGLIAENLGCTIAVHGHTHIQSIEQFGSVTVINPGSPLRPRAKSYGGFAVFSIDNTKDIGELRFYRLRRDGGGSFSAAVHTVYPIPLDSIPVKTKNAT